MELREYLRVLKRSWWIIVSLALISLTGALLFSYARTPIYESTSSYVVSLETSDTLGDTIYGLDTLSRQARIFGTYCQIMTSQNVRNEAYTLINVDPNMVGLNNYNVSCAVLPETNVLKLIVQGPAPAVVSRLNEAIGIVGIQNVKSSVTELFSLKMIDSVALNPEPISPNHWQDGVLGAVLGVVLGITLGMLSEYLRSPSQRMEALSIRNPRIGVYNERYFQQRLVEEINRATDRNRPISVAMMRLVPDEDFVLLPENAQETLLRSAALRLQDNMRKGNIIAYMGQNVFGIILPETPGDEAQEVITALQEDLRTHTFRVEDYSTTFAANSALVESAGSSMTAREMMSRANKALRGTQAVFENSVRLVRGSPRPFVEGEHEVPADGAVIATNGNGHTELKPDVKNGIAKEAPYGNPSLQ